MIKPLAIELFAGLFGWLSILTGYWWISPPGIGPGGQAPSWRPLEIYVHEADGSQGPAKTEVLNLLPDPATIPSAAPVAPSVLRRSTRS